jgi:protein involved in polysaccharide export with SLBB domain
MFPQVFGRLLLSTPSSMRRLIFLLLLAVLCPSANSLHAQTAAENPLTVGPGDIIRVQIYRVSREDDLAGDFLVDENGAVVLPLVGEKQVAGLTYRELRAQVVAAYQEQLRNPSIIVVPLRRVNILGQVKNPNQYPLDPTITLAGAVAMAGGVTEDGSMDRIRILRNGVVVRERVSLSESLSAADVRSGDQIMVDEKSWFARNTQLVVSAILAVPSIITAIIVATR